MKRMELIANRSVEHEIIEALEESIPDFFYTLLPQVHGRGKTKYRLGNAIWPEMNFMLIGYLNNDDVDTAKMAIQKIKERFPREGIKVFFMNCD
ncbi:MAG: hypothetical protein FWC97_05735 [Treponema sp.]|nr:hypothetical protein [Treponema sp.]